MNEYSDKQPAVSGFRRWRRFLIWCFGVILCLAVATYFSRDFLLSALRAYEVRRAYLAVEHFGRSLPDVDEVDILALGGEVPAGTPDSFPRDLSLPRGTVNRHTLHGTEVESLAALWRSIHLDRRFSPWCHDPYYALRFRDRGKLVLETSICWKCRTVMLPVRFPGDETCSFDATSENGQKLLSTLSQYAPHPPTPK